MGRAKKWGDRTFKADNVEDEAIKKAILQKIYDLGEDKNDASNVTTPITGN